MEVSEEEVPPIPQSVMDPSLKASDAAA
jgi:hypothetical protein